MQTTEGTAKGAQGKRIALWGDVAPHSTFYVSVVQESCAPNFFFLLPAAAAAAPFLYVFFPRVSSGSVHEKNQKLETLCALSHMAQLFRGNGCEWRLCEETRPKNHAAGWLLENIWGPNFDLSSPEQREENWCIESRWGMNWGKQGLCEMRSAGDG